MGCSKEVEELTNNSQTINHPTESETNQQSKSNSNLLSAEEAINKLQSIMNREIKMPLWLSDVELEGDMYNITLFQEISNGSTRAITKFYIDRKSSVIYYDNWNNGKREKITNFQLPDSYFSYENGIYPSSEKTTADSQLQTKMKNMDYIIVPGKSIGKIALGMTSEEVKKLLGKPTTDDEYQMIYKSSKNYIRMSLNHQIVKQIEFTSSAFSTVEGINIKNYEDKSDLFDVSEFRWRFLQIRYEFKHGGLAFFSFNADLPDDNTEEFQHYVRGYIYGGPMMYEEPISDGNWEPSK